MSEWIDTPMMPLTGVEVPEGALYNAVASRLRSWAEELRSSPANNAEDLATEHATIEVCERVALDFDWIVREWFTIPSAAPESPPDRTEPR